MRSPESIFRQLPRQPLTRWLAVLALLLAALAPTVSRAWVAQQGTSPSWSEICSAAGSPGARPSPVLLGDLAGQAVAGLDDCAYCLLMLDRLGATEPAPLPLLAAAPQVWSVPPQTPAQHRPDLRLAAPRGPPQALA